MVPATKKQRVKSQTKEATPLLASPACATMALSATVSPVTIPYPVPMALVVTKVTSGHLGVAAWTRTSVRSLNHLARHR